jgi:hypothetical protein
VMVEAQDAALAQSTAELVANTIREQCGAVT